MLNTIFEIASKETIVFGSSVTDIIISFSGSGLTWWCLGDSDNAKFLLVETLPVHNDLDRAHIAYARKLAVEWFEREMNQYFDRYDVIIDNAISEPTVKNNYNEEQNFPKVEPPELDENKKDVHTEHCCSDHHRCKYNNKKCTVISGKKKPSYPCNCKEM